jgi:hypothetical protein
MTKTKPHVAHTRFEIVAMAGDASPARRRLPVVLYGSRSVFVMTFQKINPQDLKDAFRDSLKDASRDSLQFVR